MSTMKDSAAAIAGMATAALNGRPPADAGEAAGMAMKIQAKYVAEREKRLLRHPEGNDQYLEPDSSEGLKHFSADPWVDVEEASSLRLNIPADSRLKALILGAGFGGIQYAVRFIEQGMEVDDIRLVDTAGGFGGTWYWNRYPGLMCDTESYCYLPLLEETGYMPKHQWSYGHEIREYLDKVADKYDLKTRAFFQTRITSMSWDDEAKEWVVDMMHEVDGKEPAKFTIRSQFVVVASGVLHHPKVPKIPGMGTFRGHSFHTSRFDYGYTGGSPRDTAMTKLKDKAVGIIGTGATAVQLVPELAKWARHLYVFQRTPSAVDFRDQRETDPAWFKEEVATGEGWSRRRNLNWMEHIGGPAPKPGVNLVKDAWSRMPSYAATTGGPTRVSAETVGEYIATLHSLDLARQEGIRARIDSTVDDKATAERLKAWYPGWCKRPTFHDDYLAAFNLPNVTLVDTDGRGVDALTETSVVVGGTAYKIDCLIFGTGYRSPGTGSQIGRADLVVNGRNGPFEDKYGTSSWGTLHGVITRDFPNLFLPGPSQSGVSPNFGFVLDSLARHTAAIIALAAKQAGGLDARFSVEPTAAAEEAWSNLVLDRAINFAAMSGCTPGYMNVEGAMDKLPREARMLMARMSPWGHGFPDFLRRIEEWRAQGGSEDLTVLTAAADPHAK